MQKLKLAISAEESKVEPIFNVSAVYKCAQQPTQELEMLNFVQKVRFLFYKKSKSECKRKTYFNAVTIGN